MNDTPRTDAAYAECVKQGGEYEPFHGPLIDESQKLERELAAKTEEFNWLKTVFDAATAIQGDDEVLKYVTSGNAIPVTRCTVSADLIRQLVADRQSARAAPDPECICHGNWRALVKESLPFLGKKYRDVHDGLEYTFYGVVHAEDDYYYGIYREGKARLLSCVGDLEQHGFVLAEDKPRG